MYLERAHLAFLTTLVVLVIVKMYNFQENKNPSFSPMNQKRIIVQVIFTCILFILFIYFFGKPAIEKYNDHEVFIKVAAEPEDRNQVIKILLPAITICASDVNSIIDQVFL